MSIPEAAETIVIARLTLGNKLHGKSASTVTVRGKDPMLPKTVEDW